MRHVEKSSADSDRGALAAPTRWLLAISFGPVQAFLEGARRTGDFWFASALLGDTARTLARALEQEGATLLFPVPPLDQDVPSSNKVLALVDTAGEPPAACASRAIAQTRDWLKTHCMTMLDHKMSAEKEQIDRPLAEWQLAHILQFHAAWARTDEDSFGESVYQEVELRLQERKLLRNFDQPPAPSTSGRHRSALGNGDSVLLEPSPGLRRSLGIGPRETLDAPGLVKRIGGRSDRRAWQFTPLARIAADPWLRGILAGEVGEGDAARAWLDDFEKTLRGENDALFRAGLASHVGDPAFGAFPYDGEFLYRDRVDAALRALDREAPEDLDDCRTVLEALQRLHADKRGGLPEKEYGRPSPYLAFLCADGDRVGPFLAGLPEMDDYREVAAALTGFAGAARDAVAAHEGRWIYAEGDDVLALLPLDRCLDAAAAIRERFLCALRDFESSPTLSVGIGIGHAFSPMAGRLLPLGRAALEHAKSGGEEKRDALALCIETRSGAPLRWRCGWRDNPVGRLRQWHEDFAGARLSGTLPYRLRVLARRTAWAARDPDLRDSVVRPMVRQLLVRQGGGEHEPDEALLDLLSARPEIASDCVTGLLAARWLSRNTRYDPTAGG